MGLYFCPTPPHSPEPVLPGVCPRARLTWGMSQSPSYLGYVPEPVLPGVCSTSERSGPQPAPRATGRGLRLQPWQGPPGAWRIILWWPHQGNPIHQKTHCREPRHAILPYTDIHDITEANQEIPERGVGVRVLEKAGP